MLLFGKGFWGLAPGSLPWCPHPPMRTLRKSTCGTTDGALGKLSSVAPAVRESFCGPLLRAVESRLSISAFDSFCRAAAHGRFPRLLDRQDLWQLLVLI